MTNGILTGLQQLLERFSSLQHLNVSRNQRLRMLSIGLMKACTSLLSFECQGCSLLWPLQAKFSVAKCNPQVIQSFMKSDHFILPKGIFTPSDIYVITEALPHFSGLERVDISNNPELGDAGVLEILSALTGTCTHCSLCWTGVRLCLCVTFLFVLQRRKVNS
jgi:hypothetical protein